MNEPRTSDHFDGRTFRNLTPRANGWAALLRWMASRNQGEWRTWSDSDPGPPPPAVVHGEALRVTWVNHATFLLQWHGMNILTDPMWSERASPVSWVGPRRVRAPGIRFQDLPRIHAVLLSHDHYDHFDVPTLLRLWQDHRPRIYTGYGNGRRLSELHICNVREMDWWDEIEDAQGVRVTCVPAQHFSGRTPFDRDTTLWCGFVLSPPQRADDPGCVYFAGDTGFGPHFHHVAARFAPLRLALLPIGAYLPEWFMGEVHCSPAQAIHAHRILRAQTSIAGHFGTFPMADDSETEAPEELRRLLRFEHHEGEFFIPDFGRAIDIAPLTIGRLKTG